MRASLVALLLLVSLASPATAAEISVSVVDAPRPEPRWGYAPATARLAPGAWVTWSNTGQDVHSITARDESFDSGDLLPSEGFSWYFDQPGTFEYICTLHPWMVGRVIVGDGAPPSSPGEGTGEPTELEMPSPGGDVYSA